ncbi:polyisoprenoid-binding protein [Deltaproteobacteria bacterium]|nr:polyisoprenoid-binding protein [Deltaproteobacteria bacterium]
MIHLLAFACSSEPATPPAPPVAPPPVEVAPPAPPVQAQQNTPWAIDAAATTVTASAHKVIGGHDLAFPGATGSVAIGTADGALVGLDVTVPIATLTTDAAKLTAHLITPDFFDAAAMPTATFHATSVTGAAPAYTVVGDLTIHGKTKSVTFPATANVSAGVLTATAEVLLDRKDFDLVYPGKPDNLIQDGVELKVSLVAKAP